MNRGFSLLEIIIYVSLLSLLMIGVFSSILSSMHSMMKKPTLSEENYLFLIENYHEE